MNFIKPHNIDIDNNNNSIEYIDKGNIIINNNISDHNSTIPSNRDVNTPRIKRNVLKNISRGNKKVNYIKKKEIKLDNPLSQHKDIEPKNNDEIKISELSRNKENKVY